MNDLQQRLSEIAKREGCWVGVYWGNTHLAVFDAIDPSGTIYYLDEYLRVRISAHALEDADMARQIEALQTLRAWIREAREATP